MCVYEQGGVALVVAAAEVVLLLCLGPAQRSPAPGFRETENSAEADCDWCGQLTSGRPSVTCHAASPARHASH